MSESEKNEDAAQAAPVGTLQERVEAALDEVRPHLQRDGGDIELVELTAEKVVKVKLKGACAGCPMAMQTLKNGVEKFVREKAPEIAGVESV